jgi:moderate conductance mechanosensitive channel
VLRALDQGEEGGQGWLTGEVSSALDGASDFTDEAWDFLMGTGGRILLILVVAAFVHLIVRRAITRFAKQVKETQTAERRARVRSKAPRLVATSSLFDERSAARAETLAHVLRSVATAAIWTIAFVTILGELDINLGPLIAGAGIAGVALGFGAQSLVKDFLTGFFMLVEDQLGVGDMVDLGEAIGTVEAVSFRVTRVRDVSGVVWYVPNGEIQRVANKSQDWSRALIDVPVGYATPPDEAMAVIKATADEMWQDAEWGPYVLEEPEVWGVQEFAADSQLIRLVVQTKPSEQFKVMRELRRRLWLAFQAGHIEIPFPQRTVWVRKAEDGEPVDDDENPMLNP